MANAKVWLNGQYVGTWPYGYQPFAWIDAAREFRFRERAGRPAGHGPLGLTVVSRRGALSQRVAREDKSGARGALGRLRDHALDHRRERQRPNRRDGRQPEQGERERLGPDGGPRARRGWIGRRRVATTPRLDLNVGAGLQHGRFDREVANPRRWDLATPNRYLARTTIRQGEQIVDVHDQPFGFRTIEFTPATVSSSMAAEFLLNGTCNHHDLGVARRGVEPARARAAARDPQGDGRQRAADLAQPARAELLDLADRMGFVVMVEAFDCWKQGKTAGDYSRLFDDWHAKDLQAMVRRERNHPSVIMWSIGNEIAEQNGPEMAQHLRRHRPRRGPDAPVTAGCNNPSAGTNGFQTAVDVFGLNYQHGRYRRILDHPGNEQKPTYTSESSSCISSRGEYFFPIRRGRNSEANFQVSSYDVDAPPWAQPPDEVFEALDRNPAFFGEFVWTGFDYLGEPRPTITTSPTC